MADSQRDSRSGTENPGPFSSKAFIASAAFVAGIALLGAVIAVTGGPDESKRATAAPSASAPPPAAPAPGQGLPAGSPCPATGETNDRIPLDPPPAVTWSITDGFALPASRTAGPVQINGDVARCYAHNPVGALLAAVNITARAMSAKDWRAIADQQMVGDGKMNYITTRENYEKSQGTSAALRAGEHGQLAGFKYITYGTDTAVVDLVWRSPSGTLAAGPATLRWSGGDWKNEVTISAPPGKALDNLAGYIEWSGI
ncbi:hypothetical protein ACIRBY_37075 [Streptomyces sp. NPDC096136]|uniref:hypothetical protein n=1 Tax=Streptomyces sp. NPDC096136 TaxID=3366076 RepID=UPI003813FC06